MTLDMRREIAYDEISNHGAYNLIGIQPRRTVVARGDWRGFCIGRGGRHVPRNACPHSLPPVLLWLP